ncbi:MAG: carboxylesterase family protein [Bacteroidota bacterium]|nr:carboxylesterase family protein [Bacteroidota bacterium]
MKKINLVLLSFPAFALLFPAVNMRKAESLTPNIERLTLNAERLNPYANPVQTESGLVSGYYNERTGVSAYKGIPFAAPPVGDLRWKPPQPVIPWKGTKQCLSFGPSPMQPKPVPFLFLGPEFVVPQSPLSEDCLYLNVWTAARSSKEKRPVLVWIYGGGFVTGGASAPGYSGEALAQQGIIFVSFNYRLGVFGFLSHPDLTAESPHHSSGNYGLMDQIAALNWVKKNIRAFGGDPDRITIAGQSAGAASVNCLLVSPLSRNLVRGAIGESGALVLENPILHMQSLKEAEAEGEKLAKKLNAAGLKDLRAVTATELQQKGFGLYAPITDGYVMPVSVTEAYQKGTQVHVPLLTGWNGDEGIIMGIATKENFAKQAADFGADSNLFKKYFPSRTDSESVASQIALSVDKTMGLSTYIWALKQNENSSAKTFLYQFTRKPPAEGDKKRFGAYHTAEIGYALHNLDSIRRAWQSIDRMLEKKMSAYWVRFVKTGDPNGNGDPVWDSFSGRDPRCIIFGDSILSKPLPDKDALDFLFTHYPRNK